MSATELDLPIAASAEQIRRRQFARVRRGYDPDQVRDYLHQVAEHLDRLEAQLREARLEAEAALHPQPAPKADPYRDLGNRIADLIRAADEQAEKLRHDAAEEAERVLAEARADADRVRLDAQAKAEEARASGDRALAEAREEADRAIYGLAARRESLMEQLHTMQERLLAVATELGSSIEPTVAAPAEAAGAPTAPVEAESKPAEPETTETVTLDDPFVDPRYEDLWSSTETVDLNIPPLDLEFDDGPDEPGEPLG